MLTVDIERLWNQDTSPQEIPDDNAFRHWLTSAYLDDNDSEAALVIVDAETIQTLNREYREQDKATNVLSFPANLDPVDGVRHLGDIIICAPVIATEARQQHKPVTAHWAHMAIHGMLHLQHFDHVDDDDAKIMEAKEVELLEKLGFDNPYTYNPATLN